MNQFPYMPTIPVETKARNNVEKEIILKTQIRLNKRTCGGTQFNDGLNKLG